MPRNNRPPMLRKDFLYSAECGFYHCAMCGFDFYPMEVEERDSLTGLPMCPQCDSTRTRHIVFHKDINAVQP